MTVSVGAGVVVGVVFPLSPLPLFSLFPLFPCWPVGLSGTGMTIFWTGLSQASSSGSVTKKKVDEEKTVYIGTNVEYAPYVEYRDNARHQTGNAHFLRNSVTDNTEYYKGILDAALRQ